MVTMKTVMQQLTGTEIADALVEVMEREFEDFPQVQKQYRDAMEALGQALGAACARDEMEAIQRQTASTLFFSGVLGLKANLDNFVNPLFGDFLDVDFEVYLRENTAHNLPEYQKAQRLRDRFFFQLTKEQRALYENVISYVSYLETVGPKLAHYCGYLVGNEILHLLIPGYQFDMAQTARYSAMLEEYFGRDLRPLIQTEQHPGLTAM